MKNIVIATDSFKECLRGIEVAKYIKSGFEKEIDANYTCLSIADGGEGTVEAIIDSIGGDIISVEVQGPLKIPVQGFYGLINNTAVIEVAAACGLDYLKEEEKNPLLCSSYGVGELILHAINNGVKDFIIGLGGSATNDLGLGMLQALGAKFYSNDKEIVVCGGNISTITSFDLSNLPSINITIASDVTNYLYGPNGATYIFGPQKGANSEQLKILEEGIKHFSNMYLKQTNIDMSSIIGGGAAGGIGASLVAILNAKMKSGFQVVSELINLEEVIKDADLVITGEGRMDAQSINGKAPIGVANLANKYNVKTIAICGSITNDVEVVYDYNIEAVFSIMTKPQLIEEAITDAQNNIYITSRNVARIMKRTF